MFCFKFRYFKGNRLNNIGGSGEGGALGTWAPHLGPISLIFIFGGKMAK